MGRPRLAPSNPGGLTMLAKLRSRLRPPSGYEAFAIALAFLALGSGSYAALSVTGKNVKNSSLTGKDIKNNSVTGKDVKSIRSGDVTNGSLLAQDFKAGQLPAGPKETREIEAPVGIAAPAMPGLLNLWAVLALFLG